ncbi:hypothetical protein ASG01_09920 [Chryseobacterium sp. Leaf180]|uniref:glycosyltransferase n=1 Tax=Chryseobacterium sp. Leaf180 TaxID=1736289 RepID=UPI0006F7FF84|nr:glycosyltransferase [Chryseobacterium sp. Leaf180]KQR93488.1 hypothetical protein ASG01_09920 [Chryseobacterium sp. Leaf180]
MKKIAYIEIDTHAEIAQDFLNLTKNSDEISVDFYFSKKIKNQTSALDKHVFLSSQKTILQQLQKKKYDLVIIGTAHRYFSTFLEITRRYKTAVIVHNRAFSTLSKGGLFKSIFKKDIFFRLKLFLREGLMDSGKVFKNAKSLLVLDHHLSDQNHFFLPLFYTKKFQKGQNENVTVVIPGGVSQDRRDYHTVFNKIKNASHDRNFTFVFLGKAQGELLEKLKELQKSLSKNIKIVFFPERVPTHIFDEWMKKSDVLWCPVQSETEFFSCREVYGKTKMTGNIGDAIKYGKPAIFPKSYASTHDFLIAEEDDIFSQMIVLQEKRFSFENYSKENVLKAVEKLVLDLILT